MSFADLQALVDAYVATAPMAETLEYREVSEASTGAWQTVHAQVLQGDEEQERVIGIRGSLGPFPIRVFLLKSEVPVIRWQKDQLRWSGREYRIIAPLRETASAWEVYCTF